MPHHTLRHAVLPASLFLATTLSALALRSQTSAAPAKSSTTSSAKALAKTKADGTARQTAHPWDGSPTGPGNSFEFQGREQVLRISTVMDDLKLAPGSLVADVGAGGGWLSMILARRVGPEGRVYAEEILPKYTRFIAERARRERLKNVRTVLGTTTDPRLPRNTMDAVVILNAYHEFEQPLAVLRRVRAGMKSGARLAFIERDTDAKREQALEAIRVAGHPKHRVDEQPDGNDFTDDHHLALPIVELEAAQAGFSRVKAYELGADNYVLIVEKK